MGAPGPADAPRAPGVADAQARSGPPSQLKISGCHRSETTAKAWLRIRGYISTVAKHGDDVLDALREDVEAVYRAVAAVGKPLAAAALNARVGRGGAFLDTDVDDKIEIIDLNITSTVRLATHVLSDMAARDEGRVLVTSPVAATKPGTLQASKTRPSRSCTPSPRPYRTS